ncbi:hypothetical protein EC957_010001 [Mortierella hygrophila]|uniref:Tail specific protease domain-containing protein n=1 Tax=Mortierella hygrophila TaxID=979708 RepID=A0A9P6K8C4_9FUNG|nr:hypothetical protein EC957_010001 [Mortierella hygrophila]
MVCGQALLLLSAPVANARAPGARRLPRSYTNLKIPFEPPSSPSFLPLPYTNTASTSNPARRFDYCAMAAEESNANNGTIPYNAAKGCYEMFDFDPKVRDQTVQSVRANLESFYVFYDIANSPPHMENSDLQPVNLTASLISLGNMTFRNDYSFHAALATQISQLQDPHTTYKSMCYQQFLFIQPLSTYGVYEDGRNQVKVATVLNKLDPRLTTSLVDCEVTHIDGQPAFDVVTKFAATKSYSKDRGVRLNKAFSYLAHDRTGSAYDRYALGTFAQRTKVPPNATIEYKIDCSAKRSKSTPEEKPIQTTMVLAWSALDATMLPYDDAPSYRRQFCSQDSIQTVKKFVLDSANADDFGSGKTELHNGRKKSRELYRGSYASFHMLSDGITAVFRLGTESPNKQGNYKAGFYKNIDNGFAAMEAAGAKKLIIDLQNNSGGIICWGRYVLQTLFPNTVDSPYIYSLRASPLAQVLAKATFLYEQDMTSPYAGLVDPATGEEVTDDSWMTPGDKLQGREGAFSKKVTDRFCGAVDEIKGEADEALFEPEDMLILTNGYCGSTCAVLALQLHERYGVRTVAVGGHHGQSMAFTSFPGGAVQANNTLWVQRVQKVFNSMPILDRAPLLEPLLPQSLPANGQLAFTFRQIMSASDEAQVSEYMRIPSEFRMDYTSARFRMPSVLWEDVREEVWGMPGSSESTVDETEDEKLSVPKEMIEGEEPTGEDQGEGEVGEEEDDELARAAEEADREDLEWLQGFESQSK